MSFPSYDPHARYRQRTAKRISNFLFGLIAIGIIFGFGFWFGGLQSHQKTYILEREKTLLTKEKKRLEDEITQMRAEAQTAMVRLEQLKTDHQEFLSEGPMQELVSFLKSQLEQGVDPGRLKSVILSARPPQNCSDPQTKRFIVKTPAYNGPVSQASIANDQVVISASGQSAKNTQGKKEAWFDPSQPITVSFKQKDKEAETRVGVLPIAYSVVVEDKEYRLSLNVGDKSFVKISFDHCDYP